MSVRAARKTFKGQGTPCPTRIGPVRHRSVAILRGWHRLRLLAICLLLPEVLTGQAFERAAVWISQNIQERHAPHGTILDPVFRAPDSAEIVGYSRGGDSAIWSGHYLAAEAFRYRVTGSREAFDNASRALAGIRSLVDVTGTGLLARCLVPADWPYTQSIVQEESQHGIHHARLGDRDYYWVGNTSRDQYVGVFFGLSIAYEMLGDDGIRGGIRDLVTRLLEFLLEHHWAVVMPDGAISTVFWGRADQQLSLLQIGRQVNPERFGSIYRSQRSWYARLVAPPIWIDLLDDHSRYFKFNLDTIALYHLIRLEDDGGYRQRYLDAYQTLRRTTDDHGNAHFNMIDRSLQGPDARRDEETRALLEAWLRRPLRDRWLDWRGVYPSCGADDRACQPIPVSERVRTDFLWQRSPFLLYGGGFGTIESAGVDYILPYWMARFYGVLAADPVSPRGGLLSRGRIAQRPGSSELRTRGSPEPAAADEQ